MILRKVSQGCINEEFHFASITAAAPAATLQQPALPINSVADSVRVTLITSTPDDFTVWSNGRSKQKWEIRDIIGNGDINGVVYYWADRSAKWVAN
jgi:hypothetical protein